MAQSIVTTGKKSITRGVDSSKTFSDIFSYMDDLMLENIGRILNTVKADKVKMNVIAQIYKSDEWDKAQIKMDRYQTSKLKDLKQLYRSEIDALKQQYPLSEFKMADLNAQFAQIEVMTKEMTGDLLQSIAGTKNSARAFFRATQLNLYVDNKERIYEYLGKNVLSAASRNLKTELITAQGNIYNRMRTDFFKKIQTKTEKRYIYAGVRDGKNRDVCSRYIGQIKTEAEWRAISNGQNGSMWDNRGGWNCRHMFLLVPDSYSDVQEQKLVHSFRGQA